jgi:hypothetical protein
VRHDIPANISAVPSKCHMPLPRGRMEGKVQHALGREVN